MIQPTNGFLLVEPVVRDLSSPAESEFGILMPDSAIDQGRPDLAVAEGIVVAGKAELEVDGKIVVVQKGTKVYYNYFSGNQHLLERGVKGKDDKRQDFVWERDILGVEVETDGQ